MGAPPVSLAAPLRPCASVPPAGTLFVLVPARQPEARHCGAHLRIRRGRATAASRWAAGPWGSRAPLQGRTAGGRSRRDADLQPSTAGANTARGWPGAHAHTKPWHPASSCWPPCPGPTRQEGCQRGAAQQPRAPQVQVPRSEGAAGRPEESGLSSRLRGPAPRAAACPACAAGPLAARLIQPQLLPQQGAPGPSPHLHSFHWELPQPCRNDTKPRTQLRGPSWTVALST